MNRQKFLSNILSVARHPGHSAYKEWAQYPTTKERAQALLNTRLAIEIEYNEDTSITKWAIETIGRK